jgi:YegS/Rv2252/BmrU family lipid kinase
MFKNKFILVINPISGGVDKSEIIAKVTEFATNYSTEIILFQTSGLNDEAQLRRLYFMHQPQRILIVGGDGTIKFVAETFENDDIIFGIIPAGSANGLAVDLGLPENTEENLLVAFGNNFVDIDMISINGKKSIHLSDLGLNASLVKNYENSDTRGKWGYALQIITTLVEIGDPFSATIQANNQIINCEAAMIVVANSQKYGTGVVINPEGKMDDGKFEIVILKNFDLVVFTKIVTGNIPIDTDDIQIISTESAVITTQIPVSFQIDGEYIGEETQLNIKILPSHIKVAIP